MIAAFIIGIAIGLFFYGGLWVTVRALPTTRHPILLTLSSFWGRTAIGVSGFWAATNGRWQNAVAALAGFLAGRIVIWAFVDRRHSRCT
jgi:F1F0 ATPase subunit 2